MNWDRFDQAVKAKKWKQENLATAMGIQPNKISRWKRGRVVFRVSDLLEVAKLLDVSPGWLLGEPRIEDAISREDRLILHAVRTVGYEEAFARLTRPAGQPHTGGIDPTTGAPVPPKRKGAG